MQYSKRNWYLIVQQSKSSKNFAVYLPLHTILLYNTHMYSGVIFSLSFNVRLFICSSDCSTQKACKQLVEWVFSSILRDRHEIHLLFAYGDIVMNLQSCSLCPLWPDTFVEKAGLHNRKTSVNSIKPAIVYLPKLGIWEGGTRRKDKEWYTCVIIKYRIHLKDSFPCDL